MSLLLHAITPNNASTAGAAPVGLGGSPLARIETEGLVAWASELPTSEGGEERLGRADMLAHHEVVSRLHESADGCLPARFPTWIEHTALRELLQTRQNELLVSLDRVRGCSELAVTAVWDGPEAALPALSHRPPEDAARGTRYLRERQHAFAGADRRHTRATALADQLERAVGSNLVDRQRQVCPSAAVALSLALLVPHTVAHELKARLARPQQDVRILVNGPWPPYTFAAVVKQA